MNKKAICISCFGWYETRLKYIENFLIAKGYVVDVYISDFSHIHKSPVDRIPQCKYIHVPSYSTNLSIQRIYSHYRFSNDALDILVKNEPDFVYALIPPNFVAKACAKYKMKHPETRLVFDIIDMWPESYTAPKILEFPFKCWAKIRDNNLLNADHIFTECKLYQHYLPVEVVEKSSILYLCRDSMKSQNISQWDGKIINLFYLGSINNLIDIPVIRSLLASLADDLIVNFYIIGGGEGKNRLIESLSSINISIYDYGVLFDKEQIQQIAGKCHFALNIMKKNVCVGLTIKSMDYFEMGIPMINTIKCDTTEILSKYNCGINIDSIENIAIRIKSFSTNDYNDMRQRVQIVFNDILTSAAFMNNLENGLRNIV